MGQDSLDENESLLLHSVLSQPRAATPPAEEPSAATPKSPSGRPPRSGFRRASFAVTAHRGSDPPSHPCNTHAAAQAAYGGTATTATTGRRSGGGGGGVASARRLAKQKSDLRGGAAKSPAAERALRQRLATLEARTSAPTAAPQDGWECPFRDGGLPEPIPSIRTVW